MRIAILGAGRIGSVLAFHLARAGHQITVVARGARLEALQRDRAITTIDGLVAPIRVVPLIDPETPYDLLVVTVPEHQMQPLVPQIAACAAKTVLLMFNSFSGTARFSKAIGPGRLASGFPNMMAFLENQKLRHKVDGPGMVSTLPSADLAALFQGAGLPSEVQPDMEAFLCSHAAMVVPFFVAALWLWRRDGALTWAEARTLARALREGFGVVRALGHVVLPRSVGRASRLPRPCLTAIVWGFTRSAAVRDLGQFGPSEVRWLIDTIAARAPGPTPHLLAIRP